MKYSTLAVAAATLLASPATAQSFPTVSIKGSKFFYDDTGEQFFIKGIAYQQDVGTSGNAPPGTTTTGSAQYTDPLADFSSCSRDVPYLVKAYTNTVRIYALDPTKSHDQCMQLLQSKGIYVIADLSQPGISINRDDPVWDDQVYKRYTSVIDVMVKYPNTLGFFAGNEVTNQVNNTAASAFVKAAVRDMKSYIKAQNYRTVPVGYATNDDGMIRTELAKYFNCGDHASAIDFWGYNIYSWCGDSSFQVSGYSDRTNEFKNYSVPFFFAEYGCNTVQPRKFTEIGSIFGTDMTPYWSGAIMYMYFQEANDYGLVSISGNTVTPLPDYNVYVKQMSTAKPSGVSRDSYTPAYTTPQDCPVVGPSWGAVDSPLPPTPNPQLCSCMVTSLSCTLSSSVQEADYVGLFNTVCGLNGGSACAGIEHNATSGKYGAYSMCDSKEQLSYVLDQYYQSQSSAASACDFGGKAVLQQGSVANGCSGLVQSGGSSGTGTGTSTSSGTGTGTGAKPGQSSGAAAGGVVVGRIGWGAFGVAGWVVGSAAVGVGMLLL